MKITFYDILTQAIGFLGMAITIWSFQQNTNKRILAFQIVSATLFTIHFFMLGAMPGAILNIAGVFRNIIFAFRPKKWASSTLWLYVFCGIFIGSGIYTFQTLSDLLPTLGMVFGTIALFIISPKKTRRLYIVCSVSWLIYNIINGSWAGTGTEILSLISIGIAMCRFDFKHQDLTKKSER